MISRQLYYIEVTYLEEIPWVQSQDSQYWIYGEQIGSGARFSTSIRVSPVRYHSTSAWFCYPRLVQWTHLWPKSKGLSFTRPQEVTSCLCRNGTKMSITDRVNSPSLDTILNQLPSPLIPTIFYPQFYLNVIVLSASLFQEVFPSSHDVFCMHFLPPIQVIHLTHRDSTR